MEKIHSVRIITITAALLLAACCPQKKLSENRTTDSVRVVREVEYIERLRDTVIYVTLPAESHEAVVMGDSSRLETSAARSLARINSDGTLFHSLENKPVRIPASVSVKDTSVSKTEGAERIKTERIEIPVRLPMRWYEKTLFWCGIAGISFAAVWAAVRIMRQRIKPF